MTHITDENDNLVKIELIDSSRYKLLFKKLDEKAIIPTKAKAGDMGWDLYALERVETTNHHIPGTLGYTGGVIKIKTGIACKLPAGFGALICNRSGFSTKKDAHVTAGVIDNGYTGELVVALRAHEPGVILCEPGERVAQLVLIPLVGVIAEEVNELPTTERGDTGFGSSGN